MLGFVVWFSVLLRMNFLFLNLSNFSKQTSKHKSMLVGVWEKGGGRGGGYALSNLIQQVKDIFITTEHKTNNVGLNVE